MTPKLFSELGLSPEILKAIDKLGFEQASPIQAEAIPVLLSGKDVVGQSQTGSGKTAAFAIPAIEKTDATLKAVQVLVLCPTRELAVQVSEEIHKLALFKRGIISLPIYGGQSYERQLYGLKQGAQIVIGTPGRVMDHLDRGSLRLDKLKMIILDEADVMLDMGFREDIEKILLSMPAVRQTVFFSATMPRPIKLLIEKFAREPQSVAIEQKTLTVTTVEQTYFEVDRRFKVELLTRLIDIHDLKLGIIFCNTKRMVDELVEHLEAQGYQADRLHGDMNQAQRDRVMNRFRKSGLEFLVATDVAARGIDVDDVEVVFNYDLPYDVEDYVHRIGRTGRAGRSGRAISFASGRELCQIRNVERFINVRMQRGRVPTIEEVGEARSNIVVNKLRATLQSGQFKRQDLLIERLLEEGFSSTDIVSAVLHHLQQGSEAPEDKAPTPKKSMLAQSQAQLPKAVQIAAQATESAAPQPVAPPAEAAAEAPAASEPRSKAVGAVKGSTLKDEGKSPVALPVARSAPPAARPVARPPLREPARLPERPLRRDDRGPDRGPDRGYPPEGRRPYSDEGADRGARFDRGYPRDDRGPGPGPGDRYERGSRSDDRRPVSREFPPRRDDRPVRAVRPTPVVPAVAPMPRDFEPMPPLGRAPSSAMSPVPAKAAAPASLSDKQPKVAKPEGNTRLHVNVGTLAGLGASDLVNAIMGETGLPAKVIGTVDLRDKHAFVEVAAEHANAIVAKLNRAGIAGRKVKVKEA